ncbi:MAG: 4-hydroxythreonine-4-phosphate dehydrogenase PdxA, partial [Planctomycetota bacterium]
MSQTPVRIAVTMGDPAGIGPEIVGKALVQARPALNAEYLVIGPAACRGDIAADGWTGVVGGVGYCEVPGPARWQMGRAQAECGAVAIAALRKGAELAKAGEAHALVTAPVCKEALHLAGHRVEGQTEWLAAFDGATRYEMVGIAGDLRVMLLTRHMALRAALDAIATDEVVWHLELFAETLQRTGIAQPRLALAGLNPHAGEG